MFNRKNSVGIHSSTCLLSSGVLSSEKMQKIADIAEEFGDGKLRLTPYQNIIIANIPTDSVDNALKRLQENGYPSANPYIKWTTIACAGNFCGKTIDHPKNRAKKSRIILRNALEMT